MLNAKDEYLRHVTEVNVPVLCCKVEMFKSRPWSPWQDSVVPDVMTGLRPGWSADELRGFLKALDCNYDNDYGRQILFGTIWYTDGSWSEREEYDGSEWWEHRKSPELPVEFKAKED